METSSEKGMSEKREGKEEVKEKAKVRSLTINMKKTRGK